MNDILHKISETQTCLDSRVSVIVNNDIVTSDYPSDPSLKKKLLKYATFKSTLELIWKVVFSAMLSIFNWLALPA